MLRTLIIIVALFVIVAGLAFILKRKRQKK